MDGVRLLTDPVLRDRVLHLRRHAASPGTEFEREIDAILISHPHYDHLDLPSLRRFDRGTPVIVPLGAGRLIEKAGFEAVTDFLVGEATAIKSRDGGRVEVHAVPARHTGRRRPFGAEADPIGFESSAPDASTSQVTPISSRS